MDGSCRGGTNHRFCERVSGSGRGITPRGRCKNTLWPDGSCSRNRHVVGMKCIWSASRDKLVGLLAACHVRPLKNHAPPSYASSRMYVLAAPPGASPRDRPSSLAPRASKLRLGSRLHILHCRPTTSCALWLSRMRVRVAQRQPDCPARVAGTALWIDIVLNVGVPSVLPAGWLEEEAHRGKHHVLSDELTSATGKCGLERDRPARGHVQVRRLFIRLLVEAELLPFVAQPDPCSRARLGLRAKLGRDVDGPEHPALARCRAQQLGMNRCGRRHQQEHRRAPPERRRGGIRDISPPVT
eukprot:scaffold165432_cov31-Tisochrysis_lutea.AAC.4